jgi:hypothetical protein
MRDDTSFCMSTARGVRKGKLKCFQCFISTILIQTSCLLRLLGAREMSPSERPLILASDCPVRTMNMIVWPFNVGLAKPYRKCPNLARR